MIDWFGFPVVGSMILTAVRSATVATLILACMVANSPLYAHDGVVHKSEEEALKHLLESANTEGFPSIKGGDFTLTDQFGRTRTSKSPDDRHQFLFFGYVNCKAICSVAIPRMTEAVDLLESKGIEVTPVLITVDPERDTMEAMAEAAPNLHPKMIGLTGSVKELNEAYKAFNIENKLVYTHPTEGPIFAHGTYIYLLGPDGEFKTLFPPILSSDRIAELTADYVSGLKF